MDASIDEIVEAGLLRIKELASMRKHGDVYSQSYPQAVKRCSRGDYGAVCTRNEVCEYDSSVRMHVCKPIGPNDVCVVKEGATSAELRNRMNVRFCDAFSGATPPCAVYSCTNPSALVQIKGSTPKACDELSRYHLGNNVSCSPYLPS